MLALIKQIGLILISILVFYNGLQYAKSTDSLETFVEENVLRFGYSITNSIKFQQYKSTRFLAVDNLYNLNKWTSSKTIYQLNYLPINITTLNFNSINLLPIELLTNYQCTSSKTNINIVNHQTVYIDSKPIKENFSILFSGYFGSQTGDPLVNIFIDTNTTLQNINKIPLSATLSISNRNKNTGYRITGGYYGSFSTGGENDNIITSINHYYFGKLNKQIIFSGEVFYNFNDNKIIELKTEFMSYYGWDISPFTTSFIHFENYFHRVQLSIKNLFSNFNVYFKKDGAHGKINEGNGILPAQFRQSEYSLLGRWNSKIGSKSKLQINGDLNLYKWENISINNDKKEQDYFLHEDHIINYKLSGIYSFHLTNNLSSILNAQFQSQNSYKMVSGKIDFVKSLQRTNSLKLSLSSIAYAPNVSEMYGSYQRTSTVTETQAERMFSIKGNSELAYMRANKISIEYAHQALDNSLQIIAQPFAESILNSIEQKTISSVKLFNTGEILRDAHYANKDRNIIFGSYFFINTRIIEQLFFTVETQALLKGESEFLPTLKNNFQLEFMFRKAGTVTVSWYYRSKTYWEEYIVHSVNDYYSNSGFDGVLPETSVVNLFYKFTLKSFYFFKTLQFKIIFENIFNGTQKFIPIGNSINRAFVFELSGEI